MKRRDYLTELMRQRPEWLRGSMAEPTRYMTRTHVLLHAVALRRAKVELAKLRTITNTEE